MESRHPCLIRVYFISAKRLTRLTSVVLLLKFRAIKQGNSAWSEIPEHSKQLYRKHIRGGGGGGWSIIEQGLAQAGPHIWPHLPLANVGRRNWGCQSPAGQRGLGTVSLGKGLSCRHAVEREFLCSSPLEIVHYPLDPVFQDAHGL